MSEDHQKATTTPPTTTSSSAETDSAAVEDEFATKVSVSSSPTDESTTTPDAAAEAAGGGADADDDVGDSSSSRRQQQKGGGDNSNNNQSSSSSSSALRANIESKGKNAYYYAHSSTPTGPKWDGKPNPKLLGVSKSDDDLEGVQQPKKVVVAASFDIHKSNITSYAFLDEEKYVKLYISLEGIGEKCTGDDDIELDWTETSFCLVIKNYGDEEEEKCLSFGKLSGRIIKASYKLKQDKIILILKKEKEGITWHTINDKGQQQEPDHELV